MEGKNGLWALGAYLAVALAILVAVAVGILRYTTITTVASIRPIVPPPPGEMAVAIWSPRPDHPARFTPMRPRSSASGCWKPWSKTAERAARRQAELLQTKMAELEELQARYDAMVAMTLEAWAVLRNPMNRQSGRMPCRMARIGMPRCSAKLDLARAVHESLVSELDALQGELARAYQEIERLKVAQPPRTEGPSAEVRLVETISGNVLSRIGKDAVPPLCEALLDADPIVRRWAANVLGRIGPDAGEAVTSLAALALADADSSVQAAVQGALLAIER